jgi:hypothetical protein
VVRSSRTTIASLALAHSIIDCGRPKDEAETEYTFGANYRLGELQAALAHGRDATVPGAAAVRAELGPYFEELAGEPHRRPRDAARSADHPWSFYRYVLAIDPEAFAGRTHDVVCDALEAEGVGAWTATSHVELRSLPAVPVALPWPSSTRTASIPPRCRSRSRRRRASGSPSTSTRTCSASDRTGIEEAVEALAKIQRHADELPGA